MHATRRTFVTGALAAGLASASRHPIACEALSN